MSASASTSQMSSALAIMRRMPPNKVIPRPRRPRCTHSCRTDPLSKPTHARRQIEQNLSGLINLLPEQTDELLQRVDQPLEEAACPRTGRKFLLCDYNRDGDSYRSPWWVAVWIIPLHLTPPPPLSRPTITTITTPPSPPPTLTPPSPPPTLIPPPHHHHHITNHDKVERI